MGFGHRIYRAEDPRSRILKKTAKELGSPRVEVAEALEQAAHEAIAKKNPDHSYTNVEFWSAIVLDVAEIPPQLAPAMFACSRTAGWSAHILEQKRLGVLVRPSAKYVGPGRAVAAGGLRPTAASTAAPARRPRSARQPVRRRRRAGTPSASSHAHDGLNAKLKSSTSVVVAAAEVGALHRVEQVAAGAVGLAPARRVAERQEDRRRRTPRASTARARAAEARDGEPRKRVSLPPLPAISSGAGSTRLDAPLRTEAPGRTGSTRGSPPTRGDCGCVRYSSAPHLAPVPPRRLGVVGRAHLGVEREDRGASSRGASSSSTCVIRCRSRDGPARLSRPLSDPPATART